MKCKYCGSNLTIDDDRCPFCGQENTHAVKHRSQMNYFRRRFNKTEKNVMETSKHFNQFTVKITIIAILVALNVTVLLFIANEWEFRQLIYRRDVAKNLKQYEAIMEQYELEGRYLELGEFYSRKKLEVNDHFKEYQIIGQACFTYTNAYDLILQIQIMEDNEYYSDEEKVEHLASSLSYVYSDMEKTPYSTEECFAPKHVEAMDGLKKEIKCLLMTYCHLTEEDAERFPALSEARKQVMLEEGLGIGE